MAFQHLSRNSLKQMTISKGNMPVKVKINHPGDLINRLSFLVGSMKQSVRRKSIWYSFPNSPYQRFCQPTRLPQPVTSYQLHQQ